MARASRRPFATLRRHQLQVGPFHSRAWPATGLRINEVGSEATSEERVMSGLGGSHAVRRRAVAVPDAGAAQAHARQPFGRARCADEVPGAVGTRWTGRLSASLREEASPFGAQHSTQPEKLVLCDRTVPYRTVPHRDRRVVVEWMRWLRCWHVLVDPERRERPRAGRARCDEAAVVHGLGGAGRRARRVAGGGGANARCEGGRTGRAQLRWR